VAALRRVISNAGPKTGLRTRAFRDLIEASTLTIVVDRRYALAYIVEAHRYVEAGHTRGNVVITVP
jgi:NADPH:quinone reductase-like Zn-dependent oxidoreductase